MKKIILVIGLIGLVGCSKNMSGSKEKASGGGSIELPSVTQKIELVPYQIIVRPEEGQSSNTAPIPRHEMFIEYLQRRSVILTDQEKALIRSDAESFKVYLEYSYSDIAASQSPYQIEDFQYVLQVRIGSRVIRLSDGNFNRGNIYITPAGISPTGDSLVDFSSQIILFYPTTADNFYISSSSRINTQTGEHLYNRVNVLVHHSNVFEVVLSVKNSRVVSACENYTGDLLNQYCPFSF